jgi:hypothetical protein
MSGTLDLPAGPRTPLRQVRPADPYDSEAYSTAKKLEISSPELLAQAKAEQDKQEVPKNKGGKSRRRKSRKTKKSRKTRRRHRK